MQPYRFSKKHIPLFLFLLTILAYGLVLPWTGFYWDDWPFAWIAKFLGPAEFLPAFKPFRPFLGPIFATTTSLLPPNPLAWQTLALLLRFALALTAWWTFKTIWPKARWQTLTAALFFLVFPGYSQQWVAYTHINQEWIPLLFYLLSFGFTAQALRTPKKYHRFTALAVFLLILGIFPSEYFATQEPLRFLFLWVLVSAATEGFWPRTRRALKLWLPYLLIWAVNLGWLVTYYKFGAYASYSITVTEHITPAGVLLGAGDALWKAGLYSWIRIIVLVVKSINNPSTLLTLGVIAVSFALAVFYLRRLELPGHGNNSNWGWQAVTFGLIGILIGRAPSWAAGLPLTLGSINDRFMISMMIGGSLFLAGLLDVALRKSRWKIYAVALMLALGVGGQFYNANNFRRDWSRQQEIFWQMAWRMPGLQPGTVILTHELPLEYETDMGLTAPLNWMYAPEYTGGDLPYGLLYTRTRLGRASLPSLEPATPIQFDYRTVAFHGSTSKAVTVLVPPNACLHVLDSVYTGGDTYASQPRFLRDAIPLSDLSLILADSPPPDLPPALFGKEPPHTWCFYYEKAELARQVGDWGTVAQLGNEARGHDYVPGDALEWLPFIEAYVMTGDIHLARELSILAFQDDSRPRKGLCFTWNRIQTEQTGNPAISEASSAMLEQFNCAP